MTRDQELKIELNRKTDPDYAHVLLHGPAHVYNHTPWPVRKQRLERFRERWPELVATCLKTCSQADRGAVDKPKRKA